MTLRIAYIRTAKTDHQFRVILPVQRVVGKMGLRNAILCILFLLSNVDLTHFRLILNKKKTDTSHEDLRKLLMQIRTFVKHDRKSRAKNAVGISPWLKAKCSLLRWRMYRILTVNVVRTNRRN